MEQMGAEGPGCRAMLVVEDDCALREMVVALIEVELGLRVCEAGNGAEALEILATVSPCLVITDVRMPRIDGIELVRRLRRSPATIHLRVLVVSASVSSPREAMAAGADDFLQKPFDNDDLIAKIQESLAGSGCGRPRVSPPN